MTIDDKIKLFTDRVHGWQLDIAQRCADDIQHSGFGVLSIIVSYFEMIAKFEDGYVRDSKSKEYFRKGVYSVFPDLQGDKRVSDWMLNKLYVELRCGLYHSGMTGPDISVTVEVDYPILFSENNQRVIINPRRLVLALKHHFNGYVSRLSDPQNHDLRDKFEARFNYEPKSRLYRRGHN